MAHLGIEYLVKCPAIIDLYATCVAWTVTVVNLEGPAQDGGQQGLVLRWAHSRIMPCGRTVR